MERVEQLYTAAGNQEPQHSAVRPKAHLYKTPLFFSIAISLICDTLAIAFGLRHGFYVTEKGESLAMIGTVFLILLNISYLFFTLKLIFCIVGSNFPTWEELNEVRDITVQLSTGTILGLVLFMVSLGWYMDYAYIERPRAATVEVTSTTLPISEARIVNLRTLDHSALEYNDSSLVDGDIHAGDERSLYNDTSLDSNSSLDDFLTNNTFSDYNGDTPVDSITIVDNVTSTVNSNTSLDDKSSSSGGNASSTGKRLPLEDNDLNVNIDTSLEGKNSSSRRTASGPGKTLPIIERHLVTPIIRVANTPFIALFICSFSFCLVLVIIILSVGFTNDCIVLLRERERISRPSPCTFTEERSIPTWPTPMQTDEMAYSRLVSSNSPVTFDDYAPSVGQDTVCQSQATYLTDLSASEDEATATPSSSRHRNAQDTGAGLIHGSEYATETDGATASQNGHSPRFRLPYSPCPADAPCCQRGYSIHCATCRKIGRQIGTSSPITVKTKKLSLSKKTSRNKGQTTSTPSDLLLSEVACGISSYPINQEDDGVVMVPSATSSGMRSPTLLADNTILVASAVEPKDTDRLLTTASRNLATILMHSVEETIPEESEEIEMSPTK